MLDKICEPGLSAIQLNVGLCNNLFHEFAHRPVNKLKVIIVFLPGPSDLLRCKYIFEVQPITLAFLPLFQRFRHQLKLFEQFVNDFSQSFDIPVGQNIGYLGQ